MRAYSKKDVTVPKEFYRGKYVETFESFPISRLQRLIPFTDLNSSHKVVDFACGNGMLSELVYSKVKQYVGVDFSAEFVASATERAKQRGITNATFVENEIVSFCSRHQGQFDRAFANDFSEHITDAEFVAFFTAMRSTLKPNGILYLHTPNGEYLLEILKNHEILPQQPGHIAVRKAKPYLALLRQCGFKEVKVLYLSHYLHPMKAFHFLSYLPIVGRYFQARMFLVCQP